jgi:hypothetical protein
MRPGGQCLEGRGSFMVSTEKNGPRSFHVDNLPIYGPFSIMCTWAWSHLLTTSQNDLLQADF